MLSCLRGYSDGSPAKDVLGLTTCFVVLRALHDICSSLSLGNAAGARGLQMCN